MYKKYLNSISGDRERKETEKVDAEHSPYSDPAAFSDSNLFNKLEEVMRGSHYQDDEEIIFIKSRCEIA